MKVDIVLTVEAVAPEKVRGSVCVAIDVLRASTSIVAALANGCPGIVPVETPEEARKVAAERRCLLGGEREGLKIEGFDFGNSPLEYVSERILGRFIAFTTTNGTRAIRACAGADMALIATFSNAGAVAQYIRPLDKDVLVVCAGTRGEPSIEDTVCGGMLVELLDGEPTAAADEACSLWRTHQSDLVHMMSQVSEHGKTLVELGFERDIEFAAMKNKYDIIPVYRDGLIVRKTV